MQRITKYKKYILGVIGILLTLTMVVGVKYLVKPKYEELPEVKLVKLKDIKSNKSFAIMVQNGDGYEEYTSEDNRWPDTDYVFKEAKCLDNNGSLVNDAITFADGKATLTTNKAIYCTLYFDEKSKAEITNADKICDMGTSMSIEFTTSGPVGEYYYSTNGKDFTKGSENLYSIQRIDAGTNQKIYVYVTDSDGKRSETKEYDFTAKTLGSPMTANELKTSNPKDLNTNDIQTQGGIYRYQAAPADANAAAQMTNWVMFGINECTNEYAKLSEEEKIDKYMYRIIGITEEGEMYLLKETFVKDETTNKFTWNLKNKLPDCLGDKCEWPNSDIYKRLNGTASNGNPIFVDNSYYEYMTKDGDWYNLIADHNWMYGDTNTKDNSIIYNGDAMYGIETGKTATKRYWPSEGKETCSLSSRCSEEDYTWSKSTNVTKIGLMYIHDVDYAYPGGNPESATNIRKSWIHFQKDGYNTSSSDEWLITRFGLFEPWYSDFRVWSVTVSGGLDGLSRPCDEYSFSSRPVFYLESRAKIVEGDGTKNNPFILSF